MDIHQLMQLYGIPSPNIRHGDKEKTNNVRESPDSKEPAPKSYADVLAGHNSVEKFERDAVPLTHSPTPQMEGGNVTITICEEEYEKGLQENQFNAIGRLSMRMGDPSLSTLELRKKLESVWNFTSFKILPVGSGYYQIFLTSMAHQSLVMSVGTINLKPGIFRISQWVRDFNPALQRQTNAQVWLRIYSLPIEYWRPANLFGIARAAGLPLKIDRMTLNFENCLYARILVDVDLASTLPERVLVKRKSLNFFVDLSYEEVPDFCSGCCVIGHSSARCKRMCEEPKDNQQNWKKDQNADRENKWAARYPGLAQQEEAQLNAHQRDQHTGEAEGTQREKETSYRNCIRAPGTGWVKVRPPAHNTMGGSRPMEEEGTVEERPPILEGATEKAQENDKSKTITNSSSIEAIAKTSVEDKQIEEPEKPPQTNDSTQGPILHNTFAILEGIVEGGETLPCDAATSQTNERVDTEEIDAGNPKVGTENASMVMGISAKTAHIMTYTSCSTSTRGAQTEKQIKRGKGSPQKSPVALGYVTDTPKEYDDMEDSGIDSEGEPIAYYLTRQAKKVANNKQRTGFKMRVRMNGI